MNKQLLALPLIAGCAVALVGCSPDSVVLSDILTNPSLAEWELLQNPEEATDTLCNETVACVEAMTTDGATYYRFAQVAEAEAFSKSLNESGMQSDFIVIDFTDSSFTAVERKELFEFVDDFHDSH